MTALAQRIKLHSPGQVTWPEPELSQKCASCAHFRPTVSRSEQKLAAAARLDGLPPPVLEMAGRKGVCHLVKVHQAIKGKMFIGANAIACPQFKAGEV